MGAPGKKAAEAESQDDIEAIMNEIEELQQEMGVLEDEPEEAKAAPPAVPSAPPAKSTARLKAVPRSAPAAVAQAKPAEAQIEEEMMEETMAQTTRGPDLLDQAFDPEYGEIKEEPVEEEIDAGPIAEESRSLTTAGPASGGAGGSLEMTVRGQMGVVLTHEDSGQRVTVQFARDRLTVVTGEGAEVRIPCFRKKR